MSATYLGIPLALLAATAYNVGLVQEKRALARMPALDVRRVPHVITALLAEPAWLAGFALMLLGLACQTIVLTFEPVSVVQPVLASGIVLVLVLSRLVLRERLGAVELRCVAAMAVAVILLAASTGGKGTGAGHHAVPAWMAAVMIPSAAALLVAASPLRRRPEGQRVPAAISFGLGTGLLYGVAALAIKGLSGILVAHHGAASLAAGVLASPYLYVLAASSAAGHAAVPGRAAVLPGLHPRARVHRHGQRVLPDRGYLAVPRAPAVRPGPARAAPGRHRGGRVRGHHLVPAGPGPGRRPGPGRDRTRPGRRTRLPDRPGKALMALEDALLDILVCPIDKRGLLYFADDAVLYNPRLRLLYRIEDGIPLMLAHQAVPVPEEEHQRLLKCARRGEVTRITAGQDDILND